METPEEVAQRLNGCHSALDELEKALDPLLNASQQEVDAQARQSIALFGASGLLAACRLGSGGAGCQVPLTERATIFCGCRLATHCRRRGCPWPWATPPSCCSKVSRPRWSAPELRPQ